MRGADYEINEMRGRILLTRPQAQVTRNRPLDAFTQVLLVDNMRMQSREAGRSARSQRRSCSQAFA